MINGEVLAFALYFVLIVGIGIYFFLKDRHSVHWSMVGFASWVPTRILSKEQKFASSQW